MNVDDVFPIDSGENAVEQNRNPEVPQTVMMTHNEIRANSSDASCAHHFGYLSERGNKENIPDECMICQNIVKCMFKVERS